ncbi:hypothetical protein H180DRAFT_03154 [Streptomyces sp. WMMB 322]|nr:hypothetical protein H180DRAFT_03154 [Streptomyces sp. WMMB 322]
MHRPAGADRGPARQDRRNFRSEASPPHPAPEADGPRPGPVTDDGPEGPPHFA